MSTPTTQTPPPRNRTVRDAIAASLIGLLGFGVGAGVVLWSKQDAAPPPEPAIAEPSSEPTPEPSAEPSMSEPAKLPPRADMDEWQLMLAETGFIGGMRAEDIGEFLSDDELIAAGEAAGDAYDGGKPIRGVMLEIIEAAPRLVPVPDDLEYFGSVAYLAGSAGTLLCPEHADYFDDYEDSE